MYHELKALPLVLTAEEVAQVLGLSLHLVYALLRSGQLRSLRMGKLFRIPRCALTEYLQTVS